MTHTYTRRQSLALTAALAVGAALPRAARADAKAEAAELIKRFADGKEPMKSAVTLDLPEIAENGNTVPLGVRIASPMTAQSYVTEALIIADGNPNAKTATLKFSPLSGKAEASLRIRLAQTQTVTALAKMNDGSVYMDQKVVKVTIGGCGG
ncbi:MAG TPA: thiosulfate oxidation carrier protein SoxY [Roseiarcus sp.]|nr:thiosulfate oxidation carrier protein SoxY [Roseiarcus sp.]